MAEDVRIDPMRDAGPGAESDMAVDEPASRRQRRAPAWAVGVQPQTTRPATCKTCGLVFGVGELRLCPWGARTSARWECTSCLVGSLPQEAEFRPLGRATQEDADAARMRVQAAPEQAAPGAASAGAAAGEGAGALHACQHAAPLHPAWEEQLLPDAAWWDTLRWEDALKAGATTFVQVPDRFRGALQEARHKALEVLKRARGTSEAEREWKLVLLMDMLLLSKSSEAATCGELLEERLAWFWGGQWAALWASTRAGRIVPRGSREQNDKQRAARVHTLAASGEEGASVDGSHQREARPANAGDPEKGP